MKGRRVFLNNRYMDNLFLKPHELATRDRKKKQETIFEISIGSLHHFKILLKTRFRYALFFLTIPKPLRQRLILKKDHPSRYIQEFLFNAGNPEL